VQADTKRHADADARRRAARRSRVCLRLHAGKKFAEVVRSFVGRVGTRLYLRIMRGGYEKEVAVVRHNRLTSAAAHDALAALQARLSYMTVCAPGSAAPAPLKAPRGGPRGTGEAPGDLDDDHVTAVSMALGLQVRRSGTGEWLVAHVAADGPAGSELDEGDVIVECDGAALKGQGVFDVLYLLDGAAAAQTASLRVHRPVSDSGPREGPRLLALARRPFPERSTLVSFDLPPAAAAGAPEQGQERTALAADAGSVWDGMASMAARVSPPKTLYEDSKKLVQDKVHDMSEVLEARRFELPLPSLHVALPEWDLTLPSPPAINLASLSPPALSLPHLDWPRAPAPPGDQTPGEPRADDDEAQGGGHPAETGKDKERVVREVAEDRARARERRRDEEEQRRQDEAREKERIATEIEQERRRREMEQAAREEEEARAREEEEEEDRVFKGLGFRVEGSRSRV
jgi:hypothetical protein